jgi:hypothetical protein
MWHAPSILSLQVVASLMFNFSGMLYVISNVRFIWYGIFPHQNFQIRYVSLLKLWFLRNHKLSLNLGFPRFSIREIVESCYVGLKTIIISVRGLLIGVGGGGGEDFT